MGFVETVSREFLNEIEQPLGRLLPHLAPCRALDKLVALGRHFFGLFLAHRSPEDVGLPQGEPGDLMGDCHDLFLVDDDAVGFFEDGLKFGNVIRDAALAVFALDEVGNQVHRTRPVEGHNRDDILESVGAQVDDELAHPAALQLEERRGSPRADEFVGRRIVQGDRRDREALRVGPPARIDHLDGAIDDGQRLQAQEVELHEADLLDLAHGELGDRFAVDSPVQRDVFGERFLGNHDAGRVGRRVARKSFERFG